MRALTAPQLLDAWERGALLSTPRRALLLLALACPEESPDRLARLSIGRRDQFLLHLREAAFGPQLDATASCPACAERLECTLATSDLLQSEVNSHAPANGESRMANGGPELTARAQSPSVLRAFPEPTAMPTPPAEPPPSLTLDFGEHTVTVRPPDTYDLVSLAEQPDVSDPEASLLRRCVIAARRNGADIDPDDLPLPIVAALPKALAEADPQADLELALTCPACDHAWSNPFDIANFFWSEIEAWAPRLLGEVHTLASAYGWSEADIVSLTPRRRRHYLECLGA